MEKEKSYKIVKHPEIQLLEIVWNGKLTSEEFRKGNEIFLEEINSNSLDKAIIDMEKTNFSVSGEDHNWFKESYVPLIVSSNLKTIAFVKPGAFNVLSIANLLYPYFPSKINFEIFDNFESASKWIITT